MLLSIPGGVPQPTQGAELRQESRRLIAVGTPVAGCPPHRPGRAGLPHPVPTLSFGVEALLRPWMYDFGGREPTSAQADHPRDG